MKLKPYLLLAVAAVAVAATVVSVRLVRPVVVPTLAELDQLHPSAVAAFGHATVDVLGNLSPGDWGPARRFRLAPTNGQPFNAVSRQTLGGNSRWVHDWDGDIRAFGARGDGVTDDTAAIRAAIVESARVKVPVHFPAGTYISDTLTLTPFDPTKPTTLTGETPLGAKFEREAVSIIKAKPGMSGPLVVSPWGNHLQIKNLTLHGNKSNQVGQTWPVLDLQGETYDETLLHNLLVLDAPGHGVRANRDEVRWENVRIFFSGKSGIYASNIADHTFDYLLTGYSGEHGVHFDKVGYMRVIAWDTYQNGYHGGVITNSSDLIVMQSQANDNLGHGLLLEANGFRFVNCFFQLNNAASTTYHGATPFASGTYDEVRLIGDFEYGSFESCTFGNRLSRSHRVAYLLNDQRQPSHGLYGLGLSLQNCNAHSGSYDTDKWQAWTPLRSHMSGVYDLVTGRMLNNDGRLPWSLNSSSYPFTVNQTDSFLVLAGTNRSLVLPAPTGIPDGTTWTFVDGPGNASTNPIAVSVAGNAATVAALATNLFYDSSGVFTIVKSGVNYGIQSISAPPLKTASDGSYRLRAVPAGPRLMLEGGAPGAEHGVTFGSMVLNEDPAALHRWRFFRGGGSWALGAAATPTGALIGAIYGVGMDENANWTSDLGGIEIWAAGSMSSTSTPSRLFFRTSITNDVTSGRFRRALMDQTGAWRISDDGSAATPATNLLMDLRSTSRGFGLPEMTTAQRDAMGPVQNNVMIFNATTQKAQIRAGGVWVDLH